MSTLIELTASIIASQASSTSMSSEELLKSIQLVHASLKALEAGSPIAIGTAPPTGAPKLSIKQAFKKDEVICLVCGKGGFKTLKRHLGQAHNLKPGQYRKQFNLPSTQSLSAKSYSESRRQMAIDKGLGDGLAKAREVRAAKKYSIPVEKIKAPMKSKTPVPTVNEKAPVLTVRTKAPVPAVRKKAAVPAKGTKIK